MCFIKSLTNIWIIAEIGTAKIIHTIQAELAHIAIIKRTKNGDKSSVLLIIYGTKILFSLHWIKRYKIKTIKAAFNPNQAAIAKAGNNANIGHKYGINSISPAIKARVKLFSKSIQNRLRIDNDI